MLCLNVKLVSQVGKENEIADLFRPLQAESRKEPGCILYIVHQHVDDPRKFLVYEQYKDEAALAAHRNSHHFQHYVIRGLHLLTESREADLYRPLE